MTTKRKSPSRRELEDAAYDARERLERAEKLIADFQTALHDLRAPHLGKIRADRPLYKQFYRDARDALLRYRC